MRVPHSQVRRLAVVVLALGLTAPAFATSADTASSGVVVFGSYLNPGTAERQAEVVRERLGVALAVTEVRIDDVVYHRVVSESLPEAVARQLIERAAQRGQDAWFAVAQAPRSDEVVDVAPDSPEQPSAEALPAPAPAVRVVADEPADRAVDDIAIPIAIPETAWTDRFSRIDLTGSLSAQTRLFYRRIGHAGQRSRPSGLVAMPQLYVEDRTGWSFTLSPFYRFDSDDPERTHADLHEAYALFFGSLGDGQWETRLGVDRAFWGVVESNNLVDIVNQVDLVEHPDEKSKLGQPMAYFA